MLPKANISQAEISPMGAPFLPIRALLLDDNRFDQRRIERMARDSGLMISFDVAPDLFALSEFLDQREYDVAFLDYRLPVGSGRDAVDMLHARGRNGQCATIMVAGDEFLDSAGQLMREACDTFISKDQLNPDILLATVTSILNDRAIDRIAQRNDKPDTVPAWPTDLETEVEGMIREIRHLRTQQSSGKGNLAASLLNLESRSIRLWSHIREQAIQHLGQDAKFDVLGSVIDATRRAH